MASHDLSAGDVDTALAGYLADLAARLRGPRRRREEILAEIRDGLEDALADRAGSANARGRSAAAAIDSFGTPQAVAEAFAGELATAHSRRAIAWFIATGPLVGIWWLLLLQPRPWRTGAIALLAAIPALPLVAIAIATAAAAMATTGHLMRWLPETTPRQALSATTTVAALCLCGDLAVLAVLAAEPGRAHHPLAAVAVAASLARIACSLAAVRTTRRLQRAL